MPSDVKQREPARYPPATIRLRYGRKTLRHGLALGWRTEYPAQFPVTVTSLGDSGKVADSPEAESKAA